MKLLKSKPSQLEKYQLDLVTDLKNVGIEVEFYNRTRDNQWIHISFKSREDLEFVYKNYMMKLDNSVQTDGLMLKILTF